MRSDLIVASTTELFQLSNQYMDHICSLQKQRKGSEKLREKAGNIWSSQFAGRTVQFLISSFGRECVREDGFVFGDEVLHCKALSRFRPDTVKGGYLFLFHAPDLLDKKESVLDLYLEDCWQTAIVDAGRDWLVNYFKDASRKEYSSDLFITHTFGPGFYGMGVEEIKVFFKLIDYEKLGMTLLESGMMLPEKSFAGLVLVLTEEGPVRPSDCAGCSAGCKGCLMCKSALEPQEQFSPAEEETTACHG